MKKAFSLVVAFLLSNHLLENRQLYIFSDGAQNIRKNIEAFFSFCPYTLLLDRYHLDKKMTELLSMALKGSKNDRHEILNETDRATVYKDLYAWLYVRLAEPRRKAGGKKS